MAIPLPLLHSFVTVARLQTMKAAAERLGVTPGAVSQRIRDLEERTGRRLFDRTKSGVALTADGTELFVSLDSAFEAIDAVQRGLRAVARRNRVVISAVPAFAANWLTPRLGGFAAQHPEIEITLEAATRLADLVSEPIDLAIRHGLGHYRGLKSIRLMAPELIVVASPGCIDTNGALSSPADCLRYPLLQDKGRQDWPLWLEAHGVDAPQAAEGPSFSDDFLLVRAAVSGQGLALVRDINAEDEIDAGRLVKALDIGWPTDFAYYLVGQPKVFERRNVKRFADWLVAECHGADCGFP